MDDLETEDCARDVKQRCWKADVDMSCPEACPHDDSFERNDAKNASDVIGRRDVDKDWAWVVLVTTCLIVALHDVFFTAAGMFQVEFQETFEGSRGFLAVISGLFICSPGLLGPVAGIFSSILTPRITVIVGSVLMSLGMVAASFAQTGWALLVTYGIIGGIGNVAGIGAGLIYTPAATAYTEYFTRYRQVATGFVMASPGLGTLAGPYLARWLIETYGWRYSMGLCGCLAAQICVLAALLFPASVAKTSSRCLQCVTSRRNRGSNGSGESKTTRDILRSDVNRTLLQDAEPAEQAGTRKEVTNDRLGLRLKRVLRHRLLWVVCINQFLLATGNSINMIHLPSYVISVGVPFRHFPDVYLVYGATMITVRIFGGFIFNRFGGHLVLCTFAFQVGCAFVLGLMPLYGISLPTLFVYCAVYGITYSPSYMLVTPILIQYVGQRNLTVAFGINELLVGAGYAIGPPIAGVLFDSSGTYRFSYHFAGMTVGLGAVLLTLSRCTRSEKATDNSKSNCDSAKHNSDQDAYPS
ncbi:hypothetical protein BaRGS_00030272 [Batillaria attramentaria]|uniref:Major facilitator superfamily (MFS) profile domain-containing protein n=1 Tax=Batillaria attramentaria TaxID=370345 RepID=A0ABD0JVD1_9CAEN